METLLLITTYILTGCVMVGLCMRLDLLGVGLPEDEESPVLGLVLFWPLLAIAIGAALACSFFTTIIRTIGGK